MGDADIDRTKGLVRWPSESYRQEWRERSAVPWLAVSIVLALGVPVISITDPAFYLRWIDNETTGLQEIAHALLPAMCLVIALRLLTRPLVRGDWLMTAWLTIIALGCLYLAGEEISWGQHFIGWETPESLARLNDQEETNLHNVSSWLDQRPRTLLKVGIYGGTLILPFLWLMPRSPLPERPSPSYPPLHLWPVAVGLLVVDLGGDILDQTIYEQLPWRDGELEETFIVLFMLGYMLALYRRIASLERGSGFRVVSQPAI